DLRARPGRRRALLRGHRLRPRPLLRRRKGLHLPGALRDRRWLWRRRGLPDRRLVHRQRLPGRSAGRLQPDRVRLLESVMHRLLVLVLWCFGPPTLPDETSALSLRWQAPSPCMERAQALERVRELVPTLPDPVPEAGGRLAVEVELVESGASDRPEVRAVVRFRGERGLDERRFAGASCESVAAAAVLVVAVTIDPI